MSRVEFYPHYGRFSGIQDARSHNLLFPSAFRLPRNMDAEKGIIHIIPTTPQRNCS